MKIKYIDQVPEAINSLHDKLLRIEELLRTTLALPEQADELLTIEQAAKFLNLSKVTIYSYVQHRSIPYNKRAKKLYFRRSELLEWVASGRKKTFAEIKSESQSL
ncbi:MAG: DNA-binding protein [Bacteroidetes bacterium]|jgi:excisionase family DNA binding protein|nr:DNA-binding protein [Bacteroidota bacterium]